MHKIGIDLGSTTIKIVVLDEHDNIIYKNYYCQSLFSFKSLETPKPSLPRMMATAPLKSCLS